MTSTSTSPSNSTDAVQEVTVQPLISRKELAGVGLLLVWLILAVSYLTAPLVLAVVSGFFASSVHVIGAGVVGVLLSGGLFVRLYSDPNQDASYKAVITTITPVLWAAFFIMGYLIAQVG